MSYTFTAQELSDISAAFTAADSAAPDTSLGKFLSVYSLVYDILTNESFASDNPVDGLETEV